MMQLIADRKDIDFVLHEQFELSQLSRHEKFSDFNKTVIDMIVNEARNLAIKEILPTNSIGDKTGCSYENGRVTMPSEFKAAWYQLEKGEWFAPAQAPEWGGQGIPETLNVATQNYLFGANLSLLMVAGLNHAAGKIIETFGSDRQKKYYLKNLYSGKWSGTMVLTEAESGSNLGDLTTSATKNEDGTYCLSGNKIFISGGDHDMTENIVHLVLARIEGAPKGSRGISLFVAPKFLVNDDGSLSEQNDIVCTGIEEKMGLHGSPTCSMALGSREKCIGTLIGKENKGLSIMFLMMNKARLMVGSQALSCASSAYLYALDYARNRIQGSVPGESGKKSIAIIQHPDIRRILLTMKMYTEGIRSLLCYIANLEDKKKLTENVADKVRYQNLIDILIPVAKGYVTDRALDVCNMAVQIYGGYGYTTEFPVEQLLRDVRITTIYEGTNGIQAMDLLGRKLFHRKKELYKNLIDEIDITLNRAKATPALEQMAQTLDNALTKLEQVVNKIDPALQDQDVLLSYAFASPFLEVTGDIVMAWMLLWRATIAQDRIENKPRKKELDFYAGQIKSAQFFIGSILPVTLGKMASIITFDGAAIEISDTSFGGK
ncbi:MAG: acyl-CoA dehydrogenase [Desulfobacula sp.]|nr:acyl-CoA dehydrogenase [Desulfobacula sp.]